MITIEEATGFGLTLNVIADLEGANSNALTAAENRNMPIARTAIELVKKFDRSVLTCYFEIVTWYS